MNGSLSDLLILDLSRVLAGPYATMMLGDLGARVIKIEQPGRGDDTRRWGPPFTANGESAYFLCVNRNKESMTLNLKSAEGRAILVELVRQADVLVENFKVGTMAELGLDLSSLHEVNPALIYCSITGYGQTGPYAHRQHQPPIRRRYRLVGDNGGVRVANAFGRFPGDEIAAGDISQPR